MASGHVSRIKRPNTWLHRPMLQNVKKLLPTRSRPHMALNRRDQPADDARSSGQSRHRVRWRSPDASRSRVKAYFELCSLWN
jgi:hypothetical protein